MSSHRCGTLLLYAAGNGGARAVDFRVGRLAAPASVISCRVEVLFGPVAAHISQVRLVFRPDQFPVFSLDTSWRVRSGVLRHAADGLRSVRSRVCSVSPSNGEV